MPEYLSPGVYVEEVPSAIKPIVGVSTSTAAFVGIVPNGPLDIPEDNPDYDPSKPAAGDNQPYRIWKFPYPDQQLADAKKAFTDLAKPDVKPPQPKDVTTAGLKAFRIARENLALATS